MKLVIFDLDDTLVDFAATRRIAYSRLSEMVAREGIASAAFIQACSKIDRPLFSLFEQGKLTRQEYRLRRFSEPFTLLGVTPREGLVLELNKAFMDCVNDNPLLFDDVMVVLARLREIDVRTAILTNGPSDGQRRKLKATGLAESVDQVVIGEEIGVSKPSALAFRAVVERFPIDGSDALMVGDSPDLDYDGALNAGLGALLLDRDDRHRGGSRRRIRSLRAVLADPAHLLERSPD